MHSDGHVDFLALLRWRYGSHIYSKEFRDKFEHGGLTGQIDAPHLEQGKVGGAFWSAFIPCPTNVTDFSDKNYATSKCLLLHLEFLYLDLYAKNVSQPPAPDYTMVIQCRFPGHDSALATFRAIFSVD